MSNETIEFNKRQWAIEQLTIAKMCLIRASRVIVDNNTFDVLHDVDCLIEHEMGEQNFMIENEQKRKMIFIEHVLDSPDCEFVDDFMTHISQQFDVYYKMNINNVD